MRAPKKPESPTKKVENPIATTPTIKDGTRAPRNMRLSALF
jgi:hypothetical protein